MLLSISYYHMTKSLFNALLCSLDSNVIHSCFLLDFQFHYFWFTSSTFTSIFLSLNLGRDFPGDTSGKESVCQCRRQKETQDWSPDQEDPPEEGMATHSSILAWRIPWTEEPVGLQSMGSQSIKHNWATECSTIQGCVSCTDYQVILFSGLVNPHTKVLSHKHSQELFSPMALVECIKTCPSS